MRSLTETTEQDSRRLAQAFSNAIPSNVASYVSMADGDRADVGMLVEMASGIDAEVNRLISGLPVLKVKLYAPDGLTVYSTDHADIGGSKAGSPIFQDVSATGDVASSTSFRESFAGVKGISSDTWLVETYLPIKSPAGEINWVFELYSDVTAQREAILAHTLHTMALASAIMLTLYACLVFFATRCSASMRRQYDELIESRREAEVANKIKSEFLATMSHELRTPLTSSLGGLKLLDGVHGQTIPEKAQELLGLAIRNNESLLRLVNELLDFEKALSGRFSLSPDVHDVSALTEQVMKDNEGYALSKSVSFAISVPDHPCLVTVDDSRFEQVMNNLLSNAAKFSHEGGVVDVRVTDTGSMVEVDVSDKGIGVPDGLRDKIFEPFTQLESSMTRRHKGTGLGLPICKTLVEAMGGTLTLQSKIGMGSTFTVSFKKTSAEPISVIHAANDESADMSNRPCKSA